MKLGLQLFSFRKYLKDESGYEEVFRRSHEMGAQVVQLSGGKPVSAQFIKQLTLKYELPVCITHDNFSRLENDLDGLVEEHKIYGCDKLGVGMMPKKFRTGKREDLDKFVDFLNVTAEKLGKEGMTVNYHNHWFEFAKLDGQNKTEGRSIADGQNGQQGLNAADGKNEPQGQTIYDYLIENTDSRVGFIPDTFWMRFAGCDVNEYLKKLCGRVDTLHLKDYKNKVFRAVGKGKMDFESIMKCAKENGVQNAVAELDFSFNPMKSAQFSLQTMKRIADGN